ncbi:UNVERIFIED_CONTAM: hypothetical protein Slati_2116400 [Sesamum latifolium]|uniref:Uncharacterized protein n=1 Tax=Sesamum latifolium TaxID=2727402 RepID=A0AAW2WQ33_9LAMI
MTYRPRPIPFDSSHHDEHLTPIGFHFHQCHLGAPKISSASISALIRRRLNTARRQTTTNRLLIVRLVQRTLTYPFSSTVWVDRPRFHSSLFVPDHQYGNLFMTNTPISNGSGIGSSSEMASSTHSSTESWACCSEFRVNSADLTKKWFCTANSHRIATDPPPPILLVFDCDFPTIS